MKKVLLLIMFVFQSMVSFCQVDETVLNGYKVVYLVPLDYIDGSSDKYGLANLVKERLQLLGLQVIESPTTPVGMDKCLMVKCVISHTYNFYKPYPDRVDLKFYNCVNQLVFVLEGASDNSMSNYSPEKGLAQAVKRAFKKIEYYSYHFDSARTVNKLLEAESLQLEITGLTEDSIRSILMDKTPDPIEGIYKTFQDENSTYYKIGVLKYGETYKAFVIESELSFWKKGELKAVFEKSSISDLYSVKWYLDDKQSCETFAVLSNTAILSIDFKEPETGLKTETKYIKIFPNALERKSPKEVQEITSTGSGFALSKEGILATNAHVVQDSKKIEVVFTNDSATLTFSAKILLIDKNNDVALLSITDDKFKGFNSIPYGISDKAEIGSAAYTIGFPLNNVMGTAFKVTNGIISSTSGIDDDLRYYQITVPIQPGNSGGPLFDRNGNVIGITSAKLNAKAVGTSVENVNYAIKSAYLSNLCNMLPEDIDLTARFELQGKSLEEQIKILKNFVCLIKVY